MTRLTAHRRDNTKTIFHASAATDLDVTNKLSSIHQWALAKGERLNVSIQREDGTVQTIRIGAA